jgi:hypothetical protein
VPSAFSCCRPNFGTPGPAPEQNQIIGAEEMTIMQFVKNHRRLIWYVRTAANEQWSQFDLKKIFGVKSLETGKSYDESGRGGGYVRPITKPVHKAVHTILPPVREWATDKTAEIMSSW